jgi:Beta-lactamase inhibitor (BLIP)
MGKEKVKKPFYKKWWVWVIAIIIIFAATGGGEDDAKPTSSDKGNKTEAKETSGTPAKDEPKESKNTISKEEFEQVKDGMTYEEVVKIVGSEGEMLSETGEKGTQFHTVIYSWEGDSGWGANANMTFQDGKLMAKAQAGVGGGSDIEVTLDQFNKLENGMTFEQVTEILGGEGELSSSAADTKMYSYTGKGDFGANVILSFQGNKLINKTQMGLK